MTELIHDGRWADIFNAPFRWNDRKCENANEISNDSHLCGKPVCQRSVPLSVKELVVKLSGFGPLKKGF